MSRIKLINSEYDAIVSDEDFPIVSKYVWRRSRNGYAIARINGVTMYMHRFIMNPEPHELVDHIDGIRLNNQRHNLRCCTISENNRNCVKRSGEHTSKYKGVCFSSHDKMWKTAVGNKTIGYYKTEEEAALAYDKAALEEFGDFAKINNIDPSTVVDNRRKKTSQYYGVYWFERDKGWKAQLVIDHKNTLLGVYDNEVHAAAAYNIAAKEHRQDLPLNDIPDDIVPVKRTKVKNIYPGVSPNGNKWTAYASINGKRIYVGSYDTPEEARDAREEFKKGSE
jgi:hypothetical protein